MAHPLFMKKIPSPSFRSQNTPFSPIRKFVPLLEKVKKEGVKVYELHIGQPDLETPLQIRKKIKGFSEERLSYTPSPGTSRLRKAWQKYYQTMGLSLDVSEIIATIGGSEAIFFAFSAVCDAGEELIVFEPFYTTYNSYAAMTDIKLKPVTTKAETGFHLPDRKEIEKRVSKKTRGIIVCNPNNPTGTVYSKKELRMVTDIARKNNLFIISDETYRGFVYDGEEHCSIMEVPGAKSRAILLDSVSKGFSACGARIGCLVSKNKEIITAVTKFSQARLSLPMVEQEAVVPLLENPKKYIQKIVPEYRKRRDAAFKGLKEIPGIECLKPKGAFYVIVGLPVKDAEHFVKWMLTEFRLKGETVMLSPASGFYATPKLGKNEVRVAFVLSPKKITKAMKILKRALEEYQNV